MIQVIFTVWGSRVRARVYVPTQVQIKISVLPSPPGLVLARRQPISPKKTIIVLAKTSLIRARFGVISPKITIIVNLGRLWTVRFGVVGLNSFVKYSGELNSELQPTVFYKVPTVLHAKL